MSKHIVCTLFTTYPYPQLPSQILVTALQVKVHDKECQPSSCELLPPNHEQGRQMLQTCAVNPYNR